MSKVFGLLLIIAGICVGAYVGIWWAFIGGIMDIVYAIRADVLVAGDIFFGLVKVFFAGMIGWFAAAILLIPGAAMMDDD